MTIKADRIPSGSTPEERFAKKFDQVVGNVGFNLELFVQTLTYRGGPAMQARLMGMAKSIIVHYAEMDKIRSTKLTKDAKKIAVSQSWV